MATHDRPTRKQWRWLLAAPLAIGVALGVGAIIDDQRAAEPAGDTTGAGSTCRQEVLARLRAPATAQFTDATVSFQAGETAEFYVVRGAVDSANGFGAMLRMHYRCDLTRERDLTWHVSSVLMADPART